MTVIHSLVGLIKLKAKARMKGSSGTLHTPDEILPDSQQKHADDFTLK